MPRLVQKTAHGPQQVGDKFICMCGLSQNQPFCDQSHKKTLDEDEEKLYVYQNGTREEVITSDDSEGGCCGGGGCCGNCEHEDDDHQAADKK